MKTSRSALAVWVAAGLLTIHCRNAASQMAVGAPAPDFSLTDSRGVTLSLESYRNRPLFILFGATW